MKIMTVLTAATLAFTPALASAQEQKGLVNVSVDGNTVQVPVGVAAQVCPDVDANVLAREFVGTDKVVCTINQETAAEHNIGS